MRLWSTRKPTQVWIEYDPDLGVGRTPLVAEVVWRYDGEMGDVVGVGTWSLDLGGADDETWPVFLAPSSRSTVSFMIPNSAHARSGLLDRMVVARMIDWEDGYFQSVERAFLGGDRPTIAHRFVLTPDEDACIWRGVWRARDDETGPLAAIEAGS